MLRRRAILTFGLAAFAFAWPAWTCRADEPNASRSNGSLWGRNSRSLTADIKAHQVGDTVTIIVQETATATSSATTKTSRTDSAKFDGLTSPFRTLNRLLGAVGTSASASVNGQGQTNRSGTLVTKLTAVVKEVLPNGNLVIEGTRTVGVNAEKQKVVITGIARPQDIGPDNTISSISIANATIQYDGKGPVGDRQRKGLISTIFGWLF
jgi:flagellar L-ring protein precursor FlgH